MPRVNRSEICASSEIQAFHLINRCVRRTFLCGRDKRSGKDYSHRKQWIRDRLEELAGKSLIMDRVSKDLRPVGFPILVCAGILAAWWIAAGLSLIHI